MATRIGLLRARGRSRGALLLHGQQHLSSSVGNTGNGSVRFLARLSSSSRPAAAAAAAAGRSSDAVRDSGAPASSLSFTSPAAKQQRHHHQRCSAPSPFLVRTNSRNRYGRSTSTQALFSSTSARPSDDSSISAETEDRGKGRSPAPAQMTFDGRSHKDRIAGLDDGDKYDDFVDLRLTEAGKFYPEGPAGSGQGALERAAIRGSSTAILRREAGEVLIHSIDGFASAAAQGGTADAGAPFGIEGTASEKWRKARQAREQGGSPAASGGRGDGGEGGDDSEEAEESDSAGGEAGEEDDILADVRAAAAEGAAAAAAAAEAVSAAAVAAAGGGRAEDDAADEEGPAEEDGGEGAQQKAVLGSGPIWEEMRALAQSKRKPLKDIRRVSVQAGQRSYLLTGPRGSGKSCILNQAVLHARSTGWIVLFVPDGRNLVQKGIYCQPSPVIEGLYDLPIQSLKRLKSLREAHGDQLKDINIKDPEVLARHEGATTLLDVMDKGLADEDLAGTAHYDVMRELLATTEAKVMLAIDEYNELFQMSHWHFGDDKLEAPHLTATVPLLPPLVSTSAGLAFADESLAAVANPDAAASASSPADSSKKEAQAWVDAQTGAACLPPPPANGIVVCATTGRHPPLKKLRKKKKWAPFEEVAGRLAKAVSVPVEPYSRREFLRVLKHYARVEEVVQEPLSRMEEAKVHAKSDGIPEHVFETCRGGRYITVVHE